MNPAQFILSCEHAVNTVPEAYLHLFAESEAILNSHRGIDFGAAEITKTLASGLNCPSITAEASRLLIDCNRSLHHRQVFSEFSASLSTEEKKALIEGYYQPYREAIDHLIKQTLCKNKPVIHLSIHSFTPELNGEIRQTEIGLLYDPKRNQEANFARQWQKILARHAPSLRVRMNYPYRGSADGLTTALRKQYPETSYLGIEVESNQSLVKDPHSFQQLQSVLLNSLLELSTGLKDF